jgi:hypothetical protein
MELPGSVYLYTLATLAVTFVGFSAVVIFLRQAFGGEMSKLEILISRIFIQLGFIVAAGAMLPPLLSLFAWPQTLVWRVSSMIAAIPSFMFAATYPSRRRAASGVQTPVAIWVDVLILMSTAVILILSAAGIGVEAGPGPYAASLTTILFLSGWAYLQALNMLLRGHLTRVGEGPDGRVGRAVEGR